MRLKAQEVGARPQYDRTCREKNLPHRAEPYVVRAKIPLTGHIEFTDLVRGPIRVENTEIDDFVLIRSNGATTYNFSCVIDDVDSRISHVIRGDDHINNTPKQIHLYRFFKYPEPGFAHLPMILGPDKKKLSKRHGSVSANVYRADGYLPDALLNFLARLGWSHGDQEIFTSQEMVQFFSFDHVQRASAVFNTEKLNWLNGEHIRKAPPERLQKIVTEDYSDHFKGGDLLERARAPLAAKLVALIQPKVKSVKEIAEQLVPLVTPGTVEVDASQLKWKNPEAKPVILAAVGAATDLLSQKVNAAGPGALRERAGADRIWGKVPSLADVGMTHTEIDALLRQVGETRGVKLGDLAQPMRLFVTGRMVSASLFELLAVLPWDIAEARLRKCL
jgi:glutamyl-tRNA synthetase